MSNKSIGNVRPSQVITTFGPGAIVDLQTLSVIVSGIDNWPTEEEATIREPRLERALGVKRFFPALPAKGSTFAKIGTVPSYLFPRYQVCPVCKTLSEHGPENKNTKYEKRRVLCTAPGCKGRGPKYRASTIPAPFVVACPGGHMSDFPWREYVHRGPTSCTKKMELRSFGRTGTVADLWVSCACSEDTKRSVSDAFGEKREQSLGECKQHQPWLGLDSIDPKPCLHKKKLRALQRGATNAWFPLVRSTLKIREAATAVAQALSQCSQQQLDKLDTVEKLQMMLEMEMFPSLAGFKTEEIWQTIGRMRGEAETQEIDLRWPEWETFQNPAACSLGDKDELFLEDGEVPKFAQDKLARIVLARKLLEVRALTGFTRVDYGAGSPDDGDLGPAVAPIFRDRPDWLPAVEVRGEGIFIELNEDEVARWERLPAVDKRAKAMSSKFRQWEEERGGAATPFPGARFVLLHTLAHVLIRQLSLDCGYSASSVRERIYCSTEDGRRMAGILLYTASPDSEGSLGGLVDLGSPSRFPELLMNALTTTTQCSSDPLCADHQPDVHATINGAACHACVLAAETSCENFNRFLDRNLLVPTMSDGAMAFFKV